MRILFCNYEYPPLGGGGAVLNAHLAEELAQRHEVSVLTSGALGNAHREIKGGVDITRVPVFGRNQAAAANMASMASYLPMGVIKGRDLLKSQSFDIINTHFVLPTGPVGAHLASYAGIPNVLTVHGGDLYDPSKASSPHRHAFLRMSIRKLLRKASVVVGQSRNTVDNVHKYYFPDLDCKLIPLGIRRPTTPSANKTALGFADDDFLMVTIGRLVSRKAVNQLIGLVKTLDQPSIKLIIVGDGPLKKELENQTRELGVENNVVFAGFATDGEKVNLLAASNLYVSTSQHEGFGLVFLEGMAAGLPVVCYDFGGQTDFLDDGDTGALVALNDQAAFADACRRYINSPELCAAAGEENLRRVESFYIDTCARQYEELFEKTIDLAKDQ